MKILLSSDSFATRESLYNLFKLLYENACIIQTSSLRNHTIVELINYDFIFNEIEEDSKENIELICRIKSISENSKIMILDRNKNKLNFEQSLNYSIDGYITSLNDKAEFTYMVKTVLKGKKVYEPECVKTFIESSEENQIDTLTKREQEVLNEIAKGLNNKSIAECLYITECTVKKHVSNILSKLNLNSRQEAIVYVSQLT